MRFVAGMISVAAIITGATVVASTSALAQQGPEYVNREYRFMLNFPVAPMEEDAAYVSSDGTTHAARVFSAEEGTSLYRMTVVRFPTELADVQAENHHAADLIRPRGQVLHDEPSNYDGVRGLELILTGPEGRQIYANVLYHDHHLYSLEAEVSADSPPPIRFQTSIVVLDAEGNPICLSASVPDACLTIAN